jgi:predicted Zn-dependent protease
MSYHPPRRSRGSNFSGLKLRLLIAAAIVLFSVVSYLAKGQINPITGEKQRVAENVNEEIMMGIQAAPQMGQPSRDRQSSAEVREVGARLVSRLEQRLRDKGIQNPYPFDFHLLADRSTVNAFALPGGQVFITEALFHHLEGHPGRIAGVLGHEIGHVLERHGSQRMAKGGLIQGIVGAAGVAGGGYQSANMAAYVGNIVNMKYGRDDELESDRWGIELMMLAGYSPEHLLTVMDVLERTSGGGGGPEFMSTHPRPANRREYIQSIIKEKFPNGLPSGLH